MKKWMLLGLACAVAQAQNVQDVEDALARQDYLEALNIATPLADSGDGEAQILLGHILASGRLLLDFPQAVQWYKKALEDCATWECSERAAHALGELEEMSGFSESDVADYRDKADKGDTQAMRELAYQYRVGANIEKDENAAREWLSKAAEAGDAQALVPLAKLLQESDAQAAFAWLEKAADQSPENAFYLGQAYEKGQGVAADPEKARDYYAQVAALDADLAEVHQARFALARFFAQEKDFAQAREWLEKSNDIAALYNLGAMYHHHHGVAQDLGKARDYYEKAALFYPEKFYAQQVLYGDGASPYIALAEYALGEFAANNQDKRVAEEWYRKAASKGYPVAQYALAQLIENDLEKHYWLKAAADQGFAPAWQALGDRAEGEEAARYHEGARLLQDCSDDAQKTFLVDIQWDVCGKNAKDIYESW